MSKNNHNISKEEKKSNYKVIILKVISIREIRQTYFSFLVEEISKATEILSK